MEEGEEWILDEDQHYKEKEDFSIKDFLSHVQRMREEEEEKDREPNPAPETSELTTVEKLDKQFGKNLKISNIHYRARREREEAIMRRHDDFANDLNEAEEMSASRRRVSLDL